MQKKVRNPQSSNSSVDGANLPLPPVPQQVPRPIAGPIRQAPITLKDMRNWARQQNVGTAISHYNTRAAEPKDNDLHCIKCCVAAMSVVRFRRVWEKMSFFKFFVKRHDMRGKIARGNRCPTCNEKRVNSNAIWNVKKEIKQVTQTIHARRN